VVWRGCSPLPALTVWPAFALSVFLHLWYAAAAVPVLLFFFWLPGLFFGDGKIPKRTYALLAVAAVLSVVWFAGAWQWGIDYNGVVYTFTLCAVNIAVVSFLAVAFFRELAKGTVIHNQLGLALASIRTARLVCFSVAGGDGCLGIKRRRKPNRK
jgi:drug/metabolite transporter (DMT)-like permease